MSPSEALELVDQLISQIQMSRVGHVRAQQAIAALRQAISDEKE